MIIFAQLHQRLKHLIKFEFHFPDSLLQLRRQRIETSGEGLVLQRIYNKVDYNGFFYMFYKCVNYWIKQ